MKILTKKILRDIKYQKGRSFSIIFILILAMGLYTGILLSYYNVEDSFSQKEDDLNLHSVRFQANQPVNPSNIDLSNNEDIKAWDARLTQLVNSYIKNDTDLSFTSPVHGIPITERPAVDDIIVLSGEYIQNDNEVMVEPGFLEENNLQIGDKIYINFGNKVEVMTITASVFSAEYLYNVNPKTGLPDITGVAPIWMSLTKLQDLSNFQGVNEILVRFENEIHRNEDVLEKKINSLHSNLEKQLSIDLLSTKLSQEADQEMKEGDLGALDDFARVFGGVVLLIALFAIYDNISKLIASQRNYIGTMRALGGSKYKVAIHYTSMAMTLAVIGVGIGIPFGYLISLGMVTEYAHVIGIPSPEINYHLSPVIEGVLIHLSLALIISILTSMRAAGIKPREAMSSAYITQIFTAKPIVERIAQKFGGMSPTTAIPLRNIFRNKKKSLLTIFTFSMSIVLMVAALGFVDSFNNSLDSNYEDRQKYDMEVYFSAPIQIDTVNSQLSSIEEVKLAEGFVSESISLNHSGNTKTTSIYAFPEDSKLRHFDVISGDLSGAVIPSLLASDLDLDVDDEIEVYNQSLVITGIVNEIISESVFLDLTQAQSLMSLSNNVTGIILELNDGADVDDTEELLKKVLPVSVIITTEGVQESIAYLIQGLFAIIGVMVFIGFLTVALFSFNTIVLEIMSRENEFVNLKSLGSKKSKILKIIVLQSLIVSITGSLLSIPISLLITDQVIQAMMGDLMSIDTIITTNTFVISIGSALLASATGIIAGYRHVQKIDLVESMRNRVSN